MKDKNNKPIIVIAILALVVILANVPKFNSSENFSASEFVFKNPKAKTNKSQMKVGSNTWPKIEHNNSKQSARDIASVDRSKLNIIPKKISLKKSKAMLIKRLKEKKEFYLHKDLYAIKDADFVEGEYEVIEKKLGYYVVKSKDYAPENALRVVTKDGSHSFGIFTGVLKVKLSDMSEAENLLEDRHYEIIERYDEIQRVFYKFDNYQSTMGSYQTLKTSHLVEQVEVELLEYQRESK